MDIPSSFKCPITHDVMTDPVICNDGHSYERSAIERWFESHNTSPFTNQVIDQTLITNHSLRNSIEEYFGINQQNVGIVVDSNENDFSVECFKKKNYIKLVPTDIKKKNNVNIVISIDVSASMDESAGIPGNLETQCYSRLDLVKHAVLCIIDTLDDNDKVAIVTYSNDAKILYNLQKPNKNVLKNLVKNLHVDGATNLWKGIEIGLSMPCDCVLVFTDGQPTAGYTDVQSALVQYKNRRDSSIPDVYTFGFSNSVNSKLLNSIATLSNGHFHFISDSAMLFTVMVNFLANYFTKAGDVYINNVNYGQLYYGQPRVISYKDSNVHSVRLNGIELSITDSEDIDTYIGDVYENISNVSEIDRFLSTIPRDTQIHKDLIENLESEVKMAYSSEFYNKWGKHYIYSFTNAVFNQINNNFKDPYLQHFGGSMYKELESQIVELVANMPPPQPSRTYRGQTYSVRSMESFNNRSNPCFSGVNNVSMADGTMKKVRDIQKGDIVKTHNGDATVVCVVMTICRDNITALSLIGSLVVTPWHPIYYKNTWAFPQNIHPSKLRQCEAVYSFVLDKDHTMVIENTLVITLGHNYTEPVLAHKYWGTDAVINDLKRKGEYEKGIVVLHSGTIKIDPNTGLVCSL